MEESNTLFVGHPYLKSSWSAHSGVMCPLLHFRQLRELPLAPESPYSTQYLCVNRGREMPSILCNMRQAYRVRLARKPQSQRSASVGGERSPAASHADAVGEMP